MLICKLGQRNLTWSQKANGFWMFLDKLIFPTEINRQNTFIAWLTTASHLDYSKYQNPARNIQNSFYFQLPLSYLYISWPENKQNCKLKMLVHVSHVGQVSSPVTRLEWSGFGEVGVQQFYSWLCQVDTWSLEDVDQRSLRRCHNEIPPSPRVCCFAILPMQC